MAEQASTGGLHEVSFEAFGVRLAVSTTNAAALEMVLQILPPGWQPCPLEEARPHFALLAELAGTYTLSRDGSPLHQGLELDLAVGLLDGQLRSEVARRSADLVFLHAGAVAYRGRAILVPGYSFAGKTTLVAALVRAGAGYYSDEFAPLDEDGLVHPYPRDLSLRENGRMQRRDTPVEDLGGTPGRKRLPVGLVALTNYKPNGKWQPTRLSPGEGGLALLPHLMSAGTRPEASMRALARALGRGAIVLESDRGEADELAPVLLAELEA